MPLTFRHLRLWSALLATFAYLVMGAAMARGDGTIVVDGQVYALSDLCGGGAEDGTDCPFCALADTVDLPDLPRVAAPVMRPGVAVLRPHQVALPWPRRLARPPVRGPPLTML